MAAVVITTKRIDLAAPFAAPIGGIVWLMRWVLVWFSTPAERMFFAAHRPQRTAHAKNIGMPRDARADVALRHERSAHGAVRPHPQAD
jgi:hypothetical protein